MRRIEAAPDKDKSPPDRQTACQFLHCSYFITKRYNMIVVFIRVLLRFRTDMARRKEPLRRTYRRRSRCGREKERLALRRQKANHAAHIVGMLFGKQAIKLIEDKQLHTHELQLAEPMKLQHTRS